MDLMLKETQKWLNETYGGRTGFNRVPEDGVTRAATYHGLIRAIQIELGVGSYSNTFGPGTTAAFSNISRQQQGSEPTNMIRILQGGFYTKGYPAGGLTGNFYEGTEREVRNFQRDIGIEQTGVVTAEVMKALLNTDGYELSSSQGSVHIRFVQQFLNANYGGRYFSYIPTNGVYERKTNQALIYGLQAEMGMSTSVANGNFGPGTINGCPVLFEGDTGNNVKILRGALLGNGYEAYGVGGLLTGNFDSRLRDIITDFQRELTLPPTGIADMPTIKQLLTSNGYTGRSATVCDTATIMNTSNIQTIINNGFEMVGRYLTGTVAGIRSKALTHAELDLIFSRGLKVFPIYQDGGHRSEYFKPGQGKIDAQKALIAAQSLGFNSGTTIYFAVDYDAYGFEVRDKILPYFKEIHDELSKDNGFRNYKIGIYGPRNSCIQVSNAGFAEHSFVSNMSTGFSGNLGFPMPNNWSFSQFFEMTIYSGTNESLPIDKVDTSGRDPGVSSVNPPPVNDIVRQGWSEVGRQIPFVKDKPLLFSADFEFDRTFRVIDTPPWAMDLVVSQIVTVGEGDNKITVNNGQIDLSIAAVAEELEATVSSESINTAQGFLDSLAFGIGNGDIEVVFKQIPEGMEITMNARKIDLPVPPGTEVALQVSVVFTVRNITPLTAKQILERNVLYGTIGAAALAIYFWPVSTAAGAAAISAPTPGSLSAGISALLAFLGIEEEEEEEEEG